MKRLWTLLLSFCITMSLLTVTTVTPVQAADTSGVPTDITAAGAVLIDMNSGQILYQKNKDARLYPASITKIMTAILALENGNLTDEVTTSQLARDQDGNRVYLEVGEKETLEQMLYGLLINSGNDAAVAIAEHIGGSVDNFAKMMNKKAVELGAVNTHFVNPNGLHDPNHYTTPYDMALIANYAMKNAKFRQIVSTKYYDWHGLKWNSRLVNLNSMLWEYNGAIGVKTGYTDQANQTIVTAAKRGNMELLTVLMDAPNRPIIHHQAAELLDYGFAHFSTQKVASAGETVTTFASNGTQVQARLSQDVYETVPMGQPFTFRPVVHLSVPKAPFYQGFKVGTVEYTANGQTFTTADLLSSKDVQPLPPPPKRTPLPASSKYLLIGCGLLLLLGVYRYNRLRRLRRLRDVSSIGSGLSQ